MGGYNNFLTIGHSSVTRLFVITKDVYLLAAYRSDGGGGGVLPYMS